MLDDRLMIRDHHEQTDNPYILKSWLRQMYQTKPWCDSKKRLFYPHASDFVNSVVQAKCTRVLVICPKDDPEFIAAWAVFWKLQSCTVLWWLHVRDIWRNRGIMKYIIDSTPKPAAYVLTRSHFGVDLGNKYLKKADFDYWPALTFDAVQIARRLKK